MKQTLLSVLSVCLVVTATASAGDWPQWQGPSRNGQAAEIPQALPAEKPTWTAEMLGNCHAGIAAADGKIFVPDYGQQTDALYCFDAATGRKIWTYSTPNAEEMDYNAGPRVTPLVHDKKVYLLDAFGKLVCLKVADGKKLWSVDLVSTYQAAVPEWGFSGSPLIVDGKLIVPVGGKDAALVALDPQTGKTIWKGKGFGLGYASPVVASLGGVRQVVAYDEVSLGGWDVKTGRRLWSLEPEEEWEYSVPSPLVVDGKIFTLHNQWAQLFAFDDKGKIKTNPLAYNEDVYTEMDTGVLYNGKVLAPGGGMFLLDPAAKLKVLWKDYDNELYLSSLTHIIVGGDNALVFSAEGGCGMLVPDGKGGLKLSASRKVRDKSWSAPALQGGRIFIRDSKKLYCYPVKTAPAKAAVGK